MGARASRWRAVAGFPAALGHVGVTVLRRFWDTSKANRLVLVLWQASQALAWLGLSRDRPRGRDEQAVAILVVLGSWVAIYAMPFAYRELRDRAGRRWPGWRCQVAGALGALALGAWFLAVLLGLAALGSRL